MTEEKKIIAVLERYRAEARCSNELERSHILWRLGQELEVEKESLLRQGFDKFYRNIIEVL